jgi:hypothetical protein
MLSTLKGQFPGSEIILRRNAECISDAIEEREQGCNVYRFGDLFFLPASYSQFVNILGRRPVSSVCNQFHICQQRSLRGRQARLINLAFDDCFYTLIGCSLNPQEVGMAVQSIRTPVQIRDIAGDHLFVTAGKMPFREMDRVS